MRDVVPASARKAFKNERRELSSDIMMKTACLVEGWLGERRLPQLGEDFSDLVEKVLAIHALESMDAGAIPALGLIVGEARPTWQIDGLYTGEEIRVEEERERKPIPRRRITNVVRR